jgi:hypothetical protein
MNTSVFFEPTDAKDMENLLTSYYGAIDRNGGSNKEGEKPFGSGKAILIAVYRGKVSEGINFSDSYARAVIALGIPFPSINDLKVTLKKKYQKDRAAKDATCADGETWYKQQAYRAVNQAVGRCIRHKNDFGAIYLLDPRFEEDNAMIHMSKWIREPLKHVSRLEDTLVGLKEFFRKLLPVGSEYLPSIDENPQTPILHQSNNKKVDVNFSSSIAPNSKSSHNVAEITPDTQEISRMKKGKRKAKDGAGDDSKGDSSKHQQVATGQETTCAPHLLLHFAVTGRFPNLFCSL